MFYFMVLRLRLNAQKSELQTIKSDGYVIITYIVCKHK